MQKPSQLFQRTLRTSVGADLEAPDIWLLWVGGTVSGILPISPKVGESFAFLSSPSHWHSSALSFGGLIKRSNLGDRVGELLGWG